MKKKYCLNRKLKVKKKKRLTFDAKLITYNHWWRWILVLHCRKTNEQTKFKLNFWTLGAMLGYTVPWDH